MTPGQKERPGAGAVLLVLVAAAWHALGLTSFVNWHDVAANPPIHYTDYAYHYSGAWATSHYLASGQLWGYSPYFHAGYPGGALFEADNKGVEMATWTLHALGLSLPHAFDAIVLGLIALAPLAVYPAARLAGLTAPAGAVAQLLALALWYGDATVSWTWQGSILAYTAATCGSLLVAAAFWRWAGLTGERAGGRTSLVAWFALGPPLFWLHPFAFFVLALPLGAGVLMAWPGWRWRRRLVPAAWAAWVLALNWPWLRLVLRFLPDKTGSAQFLQGGVEQLAADAPVLPLRLALLGLTGAGLWMWHRQGRRASVPAAMSIAVWLALAYAGVYVGAGDLQPYRFVIPALLLATLPAAAAVAHAWRRPQRPLGALAAMILVLAALPALYGGRPRHRLQADGTPRDYLSGPSAAEREVCATLRKQDLGSGRVMTNDWRLGAYLPPCSGAQVIGGPFLHVWTTYGHTNAGLDDVLGQPLDGIGIEELEGRFARYNVRWAVVNVEIHPDAYHLALWADDHPGLLTPIARHGVFEVYAVTRPVAPSWFLQGSGHVLAEHNRLVVRGASPGGVVLKYHWLDTLRTDPPLPTRPVRTGADPVPFLAVDNGKVTDFEILQVYH